MSGTAMILSPVRICRPQTSSKPKASRPPLAEVSGKMGNIIPEIMTEKTLETRYNKLLDDKHLLDVQLKLKSTKFIAVSRELEEAKGKISGVNASTVIIDKKTIISLLLAFDAVEEQLHDPSLPPVDKSVSGYNSHAWYTDLHDPERVLGQLQKNMVVVMTEVYELRRRAYYDAVAAEEKYEKKRDEFNKAGGEAWEKDCRIAWLGWNLHECEEREAALKNTLRSPAL